MITLSRRMPEWRWQIYGKTFSSMYERSMVGAGAAAFAVWGYVIANQTPDKVVGMQVTLNPKLLAVIIGEPESVIDGAIKFLCAPDPKSTTPDDGGRRLVKVGMFDYRVVNGKKYASIRDEEERREKNRIRMEEKRGGTKKRIPRATGSGPDVFERAAEKKIADGVPMAQVMEEDEKARAAARGEN